MQQVPHQSIHPWITQSPTHRAMVILFSWSLHPRCLGSSPPRRVLIGCCHTPMWRVPGRIQIQVHRRWRLAAPPACLHCPHRQAVKEIYQCGSCLAVLCADRGDGHLPMGRKPLEPAWPWSLAPPGGGAPMAVWPCIHGMCRHGPWWLVGARRWLCFDGWQCTVQDHVNRHWGTDTSRSIFFRIAPCAIFVACKCLVVHRARCTPAAHLQVGGGVGWMV